MLDHKIIRVRWLVVLLILIATSVSAAVPAQAVEKQATLALPWVTSTVEPDVEGGFSLSITTDENNHPHISYIGKKDDTAESPFGLKYARWNGTQWVSTFIEETVGAIASSSLALDSQGNPHISYYRVGSKELRYAHFDGAVWIIETVDTNGDVGISAELRLDSNDLPRIVYWDTTQERVLYTRFNGTKWSYSIVEDLACASPPLVIHVSMALDSNNRPHVAYNDCLYPTSLKYAVQVNGIWTSEVLNKVKGKNSGLSSSIEVDSQNRPHISFRSGWIPGGLLYVFFTGSNWKVSTPIDSDYWYGHSSSLELDSGGFPQIAYTFWPPQPDTKLIKEFRFAFLSGVQSARELIEPADPTSIRAEIALAIDNDGNYHVAFWDDATNRLKYGKRGPLRRGLFLPLLFEN